MAKEGGKAFVTSECPLAGVHIRQGIDKLGVDRLDDGAKPTLVTHPIQLFARSYGLA